MSTREKILQILVTRQHCSINELAESVEINPISVRHHITRLEADGLVDSKEERHGVGRPRRIYFLTDAGMELFPSRYLTLSNRMFDQIKKKFSPETVGDLIRDMAGGIVRDITADIQIEKFSNQERLDLLDQLLTSEGFSVDIQVKGEKVVINESSCPYIHVGQEHREVCVLDETLIQTILGTRVEQVQCMLDGDTLCTYEAELMPTSNIGVMEIQV